MKTTTRRTTTLWGGGCWRSTVTRQRMTTLGFSPLGACLRGHELAASRRHVSATAVDVRLCKGHQTGRGAVKSNLVDPGRIYTGKRPLWPCIYQRSATLITQSQSPYSGYLGGHRVPLPLNTTALLSGEQKQRRLPPKTAGKPLAEASGHGCRHDQAAGSNTRAGFFLRHDFSRQHLYVRRTSPLLSTIEDAMLG